MRFNSKLIFSFLNLQHEPACKQGGLEYGHIPSPLPFHPWTAPSFSTTLCGHLGWFSGHFWRCKRYALWYYLFYTCVHTFLSESCSMWEESTTHFLHPLPSATWNALQHCSYHNDAPQPIKVEWRQFLWIITTCLVQPQLVASPPQERRL